MSRLLATTLVVCSVWLPAQAAEVLVAVASNFVQPMQKLAAVFERDTGHRVVPVFGSTGHFYQQIRNGAPFAVLLAADATTPARLEQEGFGVTGQRFTYALGRLVLWSRKPGVVDAQGEVLKNGAGFSKLALANPELAPYGAAAVETLGRLGLLSAWRARFVQGDNIGQAWQFVATGNAPLGFVALSQVHADGRLTQGSAWVVPAEMHAPIRQEALLLKKGQGNPAAAAFLQYLRDDVARNLIRAYGYELEAPAAGAGTRKSRP